MKIVLEGVVSEELAIVARAGRIYPDLMCGVDVYRRPEIAVEDGVEIDQSRPFPFNIYLATGRHHTSDFFFGKTL